MSKELGTINRIDNETVRAMACAATAAGIAYVIGISVKKTAAAAALVGLGSAVAGNDLDGRLACAAVWTGVILFASSAGAPYRINVGEAGVALLGSLAGIKLWSYSPTKDLDYAGKPTGEKDEDGKPIMGGVVDRWLPSLAYPPIFWCVGAWCIGKVGPDWLTPAYVAWAFGCSQAGQLVQYHLKGAIAWKIDRGLGKWETRAIDAPANLYTMWKLYGLWQIYKQWER